ncbi:MAG TPA: hypothetical protein ENI95_07335 [Chloroflexi bacterium]|nr:hypothetical protein [Chloroflexota bacterium]
MRRLWPLVGLAVALVACQRTVILPTQEAEAFAAEVDDYVEDALVGLSEGDYERHARGFDETLREEIDPVITFPQAYDQIIGTLGRYQSRRLLRVEDEGRFRTVIYEAEFERDPQVTVRVVFWKTDPEHRISALWIESDLLTGR